MTALNFDFSQVNPVFEGGSFLPVSPPQGWLVVLVADEGWKPTKSGQGNMLVLKGIGQEGPVLNQEFLLRFNLQHSNPKAVAAATQELSALGHVCGLPGRIDDTAQLLNRPFRVVSVNQLDDKGQPTQYTQLDTNGIRDVNGNKAGQAGAGPQTAQPAPQAPAFPAQGGAPAGPAPFAQAQPQAAPFGAPAQPAAAPFGAPQGNPAPFGAPAAAPAAGPAWNAAPAAAPAGGAPAWAAQPGR